MRIFQQYVIQDCFKSLHTILALFYESTGVNLRLRTGKRYILSLKMYCFVAVQKPYLSTKNIAARVLWARTHQNWKHEEWKNVMFTDELCFSVRPMKNKLHVRRKKGKSLHQKFVVPTFKSGYLTISVWGGFSFSRRTPLVGTVGTFIQHTHRAIIDAHVLPFKGEKHGENNAFTLQEDICGLHRARSTATYLQNKDMNRMKGPAQSPDLNPIEIVWGLMIVLLRKQLRRPKSPMDLFNILSTIWNSLPDSYFQNLVASMPNRAASVRKNRGGSTKY